jgi:VWFA-related protein
MRRGIGAGAIAAALGAATIAPLAQSPSASGDRVAFDFLAVEADGRPVPDLRREEVTLKVDGQPREVRSLDLVRLEADDGSGTSALPPPFATNRRHSGRTILIVFNHDSIRPGKERQSVDAAVKFVANLARGDTVGLLTMPNGRIEQELTTDHARVREALVRISGQASPHASDSDRACMTRLTLETMTGVLESLAAAPGPKTIAFVSSGLLTPRRDAPLTAPPGMCEIKLDHFQDLGRAASAARAQFYVIQPEDFQVDSGRASLADPTASRFRSNDDELTGLASLAGVTGGEMFRLSAQSADRVFERVGRESSAYYIAAFLPTAAERNGLTHRVELSVTRPNVTVRVRPQVLIPKPAPERPRTVTAPQDMLRDIRRYEELPLRLTAYASPNPADSKVMVTAVAEPIDTKDPITAAAFALFNPKGRLVAQWTADSRQLETMPIIAAGLASPGDYSMRAAAIDAAGRRGMVEYQMTVRLPSAGKLVMSGLVLGISRGGRFVPRLQFATDPAAMAYAELHGQPAAGANVTARLEVTRGDEQPPMMSLRTHVGPTNEPDRRIVSGTIAVGALPPGDYLVRAIVSVDEQPVMTAARTLRKAQP